MHNANEALSQFFDFVLDGCPGCPADVKALLTEAVRPPSGHAAVAQGAEIIYAKKDELAAASAIAALNLGIDLAETAGACKLSGMDADARGSRIAAALRAIPGTKQAAAEPAEAPAPLTF